LNDFGSSQLVALLINNYDEERKEAMDFARRMPYTFVHLQADSEFQANFEKSAGAEALETVLLDRQGRVVYTVFPSSTEAVQRTARVLKALLAHEARKQSPDVHPAQ
jgi:hypothetical protein